MAVSRLNLVSVSFDKATSKKVLSKLLDLDNFHPEPASKFIEKAAVNTLDLQEDIYGNIFLQLNELKEKFGFNLQVDKIDGKIDANTDDLFSCEYLHIRFGRIPKENVEKLNNYQAAPFVFKEFNTDEVYTWCMYIATPNKEAIVDDIFASVLFERIDIPEFIQGKPEKTKEFIEKTALSNLNLQEDIYGNIFVQLNELKERFGFDLQIDQLEENEKIDALQDQSYINEFIQEVKRIKSVIDDLDKVIAENNEAIIQLQHAATLDVNFDDLFSCKYLQIRFGKIPKENVEKLNNYQSAPFVFKEFNTDEEYTWCMYITTPKQEIHVDDIFASVYFERIHIPEFIHGKPDLAIAEIQEESDFAKKQSDLLKERVMLLFKNKKRQIARIYKISKNASDIFKLYKFIVKSGDTLIITGFVPKNEIENLKKEFSEFPDVRFNIGPANSDLRLTPPTKLTNNWFVRPFKMFVEMYGVPGYNDVDPTIFVALSYTLLFGIMFGDVGQGILLSLVGYLAYKLKRMQLGAVGIRLGISSAIFGLVFGSVFGNEHILSPVFNPMDSNNTMTLLLVAVAIGVCLIIISMLFSMYINFRNKDIGEFLFDKNGVFGLLFYSSVLLEVVGMILGFTVSKLVLVVCIIAILAVFLKEPLCRKLDHKKMFPEGFGAFFMEGFFELFEVVLSFITNTMSFLRVGGFVLSHAGMMLVVYTLAEMVGGFGYWLVLIFGNIFVMGLEGLIVGIQVLRLEFYEMFSRYYKGNGIPFQTIKEK